MPAETHQRGSVAGHDDIVQLLLCLLGQNPGDVAPDATLASLGVDDDAILWDLWDEVREEFGERALGPADAIEALDCAMSIDAAAVAMSNLLSAGRHKDEDA